MRTWGRIKLPGNAFNATGSCVVSGNTVTKAATGVAGWNSYCVSSQAFTTAQVLATYGAGQYEAVGLVSTPANLAGGVTTMDYAWYARAATGEYVVYVAGAVAARYEQAPQPGDVLQVLYDGDSVGFSLNSVLQYTAVAPAASYYVGIAMFDPGDVLNNVTFGPIGSAVPLTGGMVWQLVQTDPATGLNDLVYLTTLAQCLLLNLNESPFNSTSGIPAQQAVLQQIYPDFYVAQTQQQFAPYFASLQITHQPASANNPTLTYQVAAMTHQGLILNRSVPVPI